MKSNFPGRVLLSIVVLACTCALPHHARDRSWLAPVDEYGLTLQALEQYRVLAAEDDGEILPDTDQPVKPGEPYEGVTRLGRLLRLVGDLPAEAVPDPNLYKGALVRAVRRFQRRHGLEPNGRIDKTTLAQLNTPLSFRVHQLELALERWRQHPYDPSRPAIVLNLPEFRLRAFGAGNRLELEMKIVVGQAPDRQTPLLSSQVETVIFRPYWNVPLSIQRDEMVPKIIQDPSFLVDNHLEMIGPGGYVVDGAVSENMLEQLRIGMLRLRQTPGNNNALGLVKFVFPNQYDVIMHGTPALSLFSRARRDFSHGCVRLERADELAEWVLSKESGWSRDRVVKAMHGSDSLVVNLSHPIQVVTMYATAVTQENGEVDFFNDIYGEDEVLDKAMASR